MYSKTIHMSRRSAYTQELSTTPMINNLIEESSKLFASHCTNSQLDIIQLIINPFHYAVNNSLEANICTSIERSY
jgi:hypothetical protein